MRLNTLKFFACFVFSLALCFIAPAHSAEEILLFESTVVVHEDGSMSVEEVIHVRAEGSDIRRGIYRDFPIRSKTQMGLWSYVGFHVSEILRNGKPEPYFIERQGRFDRVYIGSKNSYLRPDEYTYTLKYQTDRQLRYFKDVDELYWNTTGNFWKFPIRKVISRVVLPDIARIKRKAAYTGRFGSTNSNYQIIHEGGSSIVFATTKPLSSYEGLTVAVAWQKGVVSEPGGLTNLFNLLWDNLGFMVLLAGLFGLARYFYRTWSRLGRDPSQGTIIPLFAPPEDLSPAAVSFVHYQGMKKESRGATKPFIAALVSLAVKGRIKIVEAGDNFALEKTNEGRDSMGKGENKLYSKLLSNRESIEINKANGPKLVSAQNTFNNTITSEYEGVFFKYNLGYFFIGLAASIVTFFAFAMFQNPDEQQVVNIIASLAAGVAGSFILMLGIRRLFGWHPGGGSRILGTVFALVGGGILTVGLLGPIFVTNALANVMGLAVAAIGIMNVLFFFLIRAPTPGGRKVMDEIEGFRMYLSVAEAERMNMRDAPDMSQQLFERFLPYAIGLGVEKPWSDAFASHLANSVPDAVGHSNYNPRWYSGNNWDSGKLGRATTGLVDSMSTNMDSAMPAPKSSSGSGGGGFSGGGGGGGGGGGW